MRRFVPITLCTSHSLTPSQSTDAKTFPFGLNATAFKNRAGNRKVNFVIPMLPAILQARRVRNRLEPRPCSRNLRLRAIVEVICSLVVIYPAPDHRELVIREQTPKVEIVIVTIESSTLKQTDQRVDHNIGLLGVNHLGGHVSREIVVQSDCSQKRETVRAVSALDRSQVWPRFATEYFVQVFDHIRVDDRVASVRNRMNGKARRDVCNEWVHGVSRANGTNHEVAASDPPLQKT